MKDKEKPNRRTHGLRTITVMLALITTAVWLILLLIKHIVSGVDLASLFDDILANILGILPPIILFNFLYEYLTKEHVADEMTEQITQTLMSNPQAIDLFDEQPKKDFVRATIQTLVGDEESEMVYGVVEPYLSQHYNIRRFFRYSITLRDYTDNPLFPSDRYMRVYEDLKYKKHYIGDNTLPPRFQLGFFVSNAELDRELHKQTFLFRENLTIDEAELRAMAAWSDEEKRAFAEKEMSLRIFIDDLPCTLEHVVIDPNGILVDLSSRHNAGKQELKIEVMFNMPQRKGYSEFLVSINEPTYSPNIQLSYPESTMQVTMFPFLNDGDECLVQNAMRNTGSCDIYLQEKWIYPMSGVVFIVQDKKKAADAV
ncbi:MAG TPA: hypothetical protein H9684_08595 [Firmicutes bacterium]|nr:hypothetical protein [Bacillota bacterium]